MGGIGRRGFHEGVPATRVNGALGRRDFLGGALAMGALGAAVPLRLARSQARVTQPTEFVIRNAYVLTMDGALGDLPNADVHVRNGAIAAVGRALQAPGAERIDGAGMLVLPGLVETHWHIWGTLLRSLSWCSGISIPTRWWTRSRYNHW